MLPILLFNNMEGGSNSLNNNPSSSFSSVYDESVILNCVRSRKKVSELPNCPVCSCTIRQGELESHLSLEVERLTKLSSGSKRKLSVNTSPMAMPGSSTASHDPVADDQEIDVSGCPGSDVYNRVHQNRLQRLRARRRSTPPVTQTHGECPVCGANLPVSRLQRHAWRCLKRTGASMDEDVPDTSSEEGSIDVENDVPSEEGAGGSFGAEYSWCGQWRIRAAALQQAEARSAPTGIRRASNDQALVVDGDEDTELYGPPQYSPSRIAPDADIGHDVNEQADEAQVGEETARHAEEAARRPNVVHPIPPRTNGVVAASAETRIQALKAKIKELETKQDSAAQAKCLICLGPYVSPAVSIQCWHVYCEVCWLQSLRAKKICPHCSAITTSQHLRRIYM